MNNKVDVQALEQKISELEDRVEKMRRDYNDLMYNLEEENFSDELRQKINTKTNVEAVNYRVTLLEQRIAKAGL